MGIRGSCEVVVKLVQSRCGTVGKGKGRGQTRVVRLVTYMAALPLGSKSEESMLLVLLLLMRW